MVDPQDLQEAQTNPTPTTGLVPGAGVPANPAGILSGAPDLATAVAQAYLTHLTRNQPPPTQAVQQQAAAKAAANQPVDTSAKPAGLNGAPATSSLGGSQSQPDAPARPGSFGSKLAGVFDAASAGLGDAAHASDTRGGWLTGITNTLNARNQRLAQQQKDQLLQAKTQAETVEMHRNMYRQATADRQAGYAGNQNYVDTMSVNHETESGITDAQLRDKMKDKNFADNYYVRATSEDPVLDPKTGKQKIDKKTGDPIFTPTYTIINRATTSGEPDNIEVSPEMSADAKRLLGNTIPPKTRLTTEQYTGLDGLVNLARNAVNVINTSREKPLTDDEVKAIQPYLNDPTIRTAISHVPGSAYAGLMQYQQNADDRIAALIPQAEQAKAAKNQNAYDAVQAQIEDLQKEKVKVNQFASQAISPAQIAAYDKKADENISLAKKVLTDGSILTGDKASGVLAQLQENLNNATDPKQRVELTRAISAAKVARDNYFEDLKRKANADQFAKQGDPIAAGRLLANHDLTLADLRTRQTTSEFIEQAVDAAKKIDKGYNPADEVAFENVAKSPRNETLFGSSRSIIEAGGTADQIVNLGRQLPDTGFPRLNSYEDWVKMEADHGAFSGYASLALGLADDYGKVMGGGAASDRARDHALALLSQAHTQDARVAAVRELVNATMSQRKGTIGNNSFTDRQYNNFDKSPLATAWTQQNAADVTAANQHQQQQQKLGSGQQPSVPVGPKGGTNPMVSADGKTRIWQLGNQWVTADGNPYKP